MLIYLVASVGSIGGGWLAGWLMKRGATVNFARKLTLLACSLCVLPVFYSALTNNPWVAAALITLAAFGHQAWSSNVYCLAGDMFPKRFVASLTGFGGMVGCLGSMALFFATGKILKVTGNYLPVFIIASAAYILALGLIHLVVPKLDPAEIK
jgi:ACS family hexuronate transporter-like MFS transporter